MNRNLHILISIATLFGCTGAPDTKKSVAGQSSPADSTLINTQHLDHLYTPVTFKNGVKAAGIYIYSEAPDYKLVTDSDEGFTCVDDVSRAALFYLRNKTFLSDTAIQNKAASLVNFVLQMQAANGYFYNFLLPGDTINTTHETSRAEGGWWSWRALQTLTEAMPLLKKVDATLAQKTEASIERLLVNIKSDMVEIPKTTKMVNGVMVPQWLPAGSGTDQAAILILGLINYCAQNDDAVLKKYIRKLADGIVLMQQTDKTQKPHSFFLSWENTWHAYGSDQAYALMKAGSFLKDSSYIKKALAEVDHFYPWLLNSGMKSSFSLKKDKNRLTLANEQQFAQIAYGIRPMIFAALEAYDITANEKHMVVAVELAGWFSGKNDAGKVMYDKNTGRCLDGIIGPNQVNKNSGAESTIEALLALQRLEQYLDARKSPDKYE
ncbi:MAG TPA: hypothetical protein VEY06_01610 [Flavisolibacter sp.]|nr:hypothetical protein [Flavisolibacter sp.]